MANQVNQRFRVVKLVRRYLRTQTTRSPKGIHIDTRLYERHIANSKALKLSRSAVAKVYNAITDYILEYSDSANPPMPKRISAANATVEDLVDFAENLIIKENLSLSLCGYLKKSEVLNAADIPPVEKPATETKEETKQENEASKDGPFIDFREHYSLKNGYFYAVANCRVVTEEAFVICLKIEGYPILYVYQQDKNNAALVDSLSQSTGFTRGEILESIQTDFDKNLEVLEKEDDIVSLMLNDFIERTVAKGKAVDLYFLTSNFTKYGSEFEFPDAAQKEARKRETLISSIASKLDPDEAAFLKSLIKVD